MKVFAPLSACILLALAALSAGDATAQTSASDDTLRAVGNLLRNNPAAADAPAEEGMNGEEMIDGENIPEADMAPDGEQAAPGDTPAKRIPAADPDAPPVPGRLYARLTEATGALGGSVRWRVYRAAPEADGSFTTVAASDDAQPVINVAPGEYVAVAVFGHAVGTRKITVTREPFREAVTLNAGGLRMTAIKLDGSKLPPKAVKLSIYAAEQDEFGQRKLVVENAHPGRVIVLNSGSYHIVSQYGDGNSAVRDDVKIEAGQLTDARITHSAARITFKLVNESGGEALANTAWSILSPAGDVVKESYGAFPTHILAAGEYSVIARHEGDVFNRSFSVQPGIPQEVEVVAQ